MKLIPATVPADRDARMKREVAREGSPRVICFQGDGKENGEESSATQ